MMDQGNLSHLRRRPVVCLIAIILWSGAACGWGSPAASESARISVFNRLLHQWERGDHPREVARALLDYRARYGKSPRVDYMLAGSLCHVPDTVQEGYNHFRWMLGYYRLDAPSRRLIKAHLDAIRINPRARTVALSFRQAAAGWVASVEGSLIMAFREKSPIEQAAATGTLATVRTFFDDPRPQGSPDADSLSAAVALVAGRRDPEGVRILRFLLDRGASIRGEPGLIALLEAAQHGQAESVRLLLERGLRLTGDDNDATTSLTTSAFLRAAGRDDADGTAIVRLLAGGGIDANVKDPLTGDTALLTAARRGALATVRLLLDKGADTGARFGEGASRSSREVNVGVLGRMKVLDFDGEWQEVGATPLMVAAGRADPTGVAMVQLLLDRGAPAKGPDGARALLLAAASGSVPKVRLLVRAGVDVNSRNAAGATALIVAVEYGAADVARFLLRRGARAQATGSGGTTPLMLATRYGYRDLAHLLKQAGARS